MDSFAGVQKIHFDRRAVSYSIQDCVVQALTRVEYVKLSAQALPFRMRDARTWVWVREKCHSGSRCRWSFSEFFFFLVSANSNVREHTAEVFDSEKNIWKKRKRKRRRE